MFSFTVIRKAVSVKQYEAVMSDVSVAPPTTLTLQQQREWLADAASGAEDGHLRHLQTQQRFTWTDEAEKSYDLRVHTEARVVLNARDAERARNIFSGWEEGGIAIAQKFRWDPLGSA